MKILIWSQHFWPESFLINQLAVELVKKGVEVTIITGKPNYPDGKIFQNYKIFGFQKEFHQGVKIIRIPIIPRGSGSFINLLFNYISFIFSGYIFAPFCLYKKKYDAIFVYATSPILQTLPAIFISRLKSIPLILWVQDLWPDVLFSTGFIKSNWILNFVSKVVSYIYNQTNLILIQSEGFRKRVENLTNDKNKIEYYPNFHEDFKKTIPTELSEYIDINDIKKHFSIVFAGNIGIGQSCDTVVSAAELLKNYSSIRFYLIGSGSRLKEVKKQIESKNLKNVTLTGYIPTIEMQRIYAATSAFLISLKDDVALSSTIPYKLQGYMSSGKPIIGSLNGEVRRIILESNVGIVCDPEDHYGLAAAIIKLYRMSLNERVQLGENGYNYFKKNFDMDTNINQLILKIEKMI